MGKWVQGSGGGVKVEWTFDPEARLNKAARALPGRVVEQLGGAGEAFLDAIRGGWPVGKRGKGGAKYFKLGGKTIRSSHPPSRSLLRLELELGQARLAAVIVSPAPYTLYIRSEQNGLGGKSAWEELVKKPARFVAVELGREILGRAAPDVFRREAA